MLIMDTNERTNEEKTRTTQMQHFAEFINKVEALFLKNKNEYFYNVYTEKHDLLSKFYCNEI